MIWIGLLGPLDVRTDDGRVSIASAKQRSLLAALALRPGNVVPIDSLADTVWDGSLLPSWKATLRNHVSRLRKVLGAEAGARIEARGDGYILNVAAHDVDVLLFQTLSEDGRRAAVNDDWYDASVLLSQADALWRGTPFADVSSRRIRDENLRYLEERRIDATEAAIEATVRLSVHGSIGVIPRLRQLIDQHPERERFYMLLTLALYRSARQAEATQVFPAAREYIIAGYGIEPSLEVRNMHERVLALDQALLVEPLLGALWQPSVEPSR